MFDWVEKLVSARALEQVHDVCVLFCREYGFDYFHYGVRIPVSFSKPQFAFVSGYPDQWWYHYKQQEYLLVDPVVIHCANATVPFFWRDSIEKNAPCFGNKAVLSDAFEFGLRSGVSIPVRSASGETGIFSVVLNSDTNLRAQFESVAAAQFISSYVHDAVLRIVRDKNTATTNRTLSERERECLMWAAEGKTSWETAQILNVSERTIIFHLQNATEKLNVTNKTHAIARAVMENLISPLRLSSFESNSPKSKTLSKKN